MPFGKEKFSGQTGKLLAGAAWAPGSVSCPREGLGPEGLGQKQPKKR